MLSIYLSVLMCEYIDTESAVNSFVLGEKYLFSGLGIVFNDCIRLVWVGGDLIVVVDVSTIWILVPVGCDLYRWWLVF